MCARYIGVLSRYFKLVFMLFTQGHVLMLGTLSAVRKTTVLVAFHSTATVTSSAISLATVATTSTQLALHVSRK